MSAQFDNFNSNLNNNRVYLESKTESGFIRIYKVKSEIYAIDNENKIVATTPKISESGLNWLKSACRGWGGWNTKLKWIVKSEIIKSIIY